MAMVVKNKLQNIYKACGDLLISRKQTTKFSLINALPLLLASNLGILHCMQAVGKTFVKVSNSNRRQIWGHIEKN